MEAIKQDDDLESALAHCDKIIAEGDDIERDFFSMVKQTLLADDGEERIDEMWSIYKKHTLNKEGK